MLSTITKSIKPAHNSGLLQWLLPDFPTENPLLNGMFCYICNGLVLVFRHIFKPQNVKCNIFSELTPKTSLLFFRLKILKFVAEKSCVTIETRTELCVEIRCVKICCAWQTKFTWYLKPENQTLSINVAFSFFKFRKYNTAFNSGLKIWLVSGIFWNGAVV